MSNQGNPWISIRAYFQINGIKVSQPKVQTKEEIDWLDMSTINQLDTRVFKDFEYLWKLPPDTFTKTPLSTPEQPYCDCPTVEDCTKVVGVSGEMLYCHNCHRERLDSVVLANTKKCYLYLTCPHGNECKVCNL